MAIAAQRKITPSRNLADVIAKGGDRREDHEPHERESQRGFTSSPRWGSGSTCTELQGRGPQPRTGSAGWASAAVDDLTVRIHHLPAAGSRIVVGPRRSPGGDGPCGWSAAPRRHSSGGVRSSRCRCAGEGHDEKKTVRGSREQGGSSVWINASSHCLVLLSSRPRGLF
jgi:hypothetical protein